ncbi:ABC transporter permease subunit [Eubacteriaceae bacterium ES2]|nr:ABC transporter permease subunit [Eubacteriaceae bacterium ES2]
MKRLFLAIMVLCLIFLSGCSDVTKVLPPTESAKIGTMIGTLSESLASEEYPEAEISRFNNYIDESAALMAGKIDYAIMDYATARNMIKSNGGLTILPESLTDEVTAMALNKENTELNQQINAVLDRYLSDGTMDEIIGHWFPEDGVDYQIVDLPQNESGPVLKVAVTTLTEPRCFIKDGEITGMNVELLSRMAYDLGMQVEFQDMDFKAMIDSLQAGNSDVVAAMYNTPERAEKVDFSAGYFPNPQVFVVREDRIATTESNDETITSNDELNGKRVGFITGMVHIENFRPLYKAEEYEFNDFSSMLEALKADKIDALLTSQSKVAEILAQNSELVALSPYADISAAIGVSKDNTQVGDALDAEVQAMIADGSLTMLSEKWLGDNEEEKVLSELDLTGGQGTLIAGVLGDDYPYSYYKDNELVGLEVDLARNLASRLGMNVEIKTMDFSAIIPSITSGKIDLAFYLAYSPERAQSIRFLTPLMSDQAVAIVKDQSAVASESGFSALVTSLGASFNRTFIVEDRYLLILEGLWTTILISLLSLLFGSILGALVCIMRRSKIKLISGLAIVYIRLIQGIPIVLTLMILYYVIFAAVNIDPILIAVIGFSVNFAAYSAEIFRTAIEATDKGQLEAAYALGFTKISSFFRVTLPQALRHILPIFKGEFISMVKMTSVVGYIAIQDLTKMTDIIRSRTFEAFFPLIMTAAIYFVITYLFILLLGMLEVQIDPKRRKRAVKGVIECNAEEVKK